MQRLPLPFLPHDQPTLNITWLQIPSASVAWIHNFIHFIHVVSGSTLNQYHAVFARHRVQVDLDLGMWLLEVQDLYHSLVPLHRLQLEVDLSYP